MNLIAGKLFGTIGQPGHAIAASAFQLPNCSIAAWKTSRKLTVNTISRSGQ